MLFLLRVEHKDEFVATYLIRAIDLVEAKSKLEDWLSEEYSIRNGDWYVDSLGDSVRIETLAKLQSLDDLTKWIPMIGE